MKSKLRQILICPKCKGDLRLETTRQEGEEITEGWLHCDACRLRYPIAEGIPRFLLTDS